MSERKKPVIKKRTVEDDAPPATVEKPKEEKKHTPKRRERETSVFEDADDGSSQNPNVIDIPTVFTTPETGGSSMDISSMSVDDVIVPNIPASGHKKSSTTSDSNNNSFKIFYTTKHYWEDACPPHTLVVARNEEEARQTLIKDLHSAFKEVEIRLGKQIFEQFPLQGPGVCVLSIGLGEIQNISDEFSNRPIIRSYDSESSNGRYNYYVCTSHYTSVVTPAASVIMARSNEEATLFMLKLLKEIGTPETRDLIVNKVEMTNPATYFLGRRKKIAPRNARADLHQPMFQAEYNPYTSSYQKNSTPSSIYNKSDLLQGLGFSPDLMQ